MQLTSTSPLQVLNTTKPLVYAGGNPDCVQVPVMFSQSALASSARMTFTLSRGVGDTGFLFLHFTGLDPAVDVTSRVFTVTISSGGEFVVNPLNQSLATNGDAIGWWLDKVKFTSTVSEIVEFVPNYYSVYGSGVNAA